MIGKPEEMYVQIIMEGVLTIPVYLTEEDAMEQCISSKELKGFRCQIIDINKTEEE